MASMDHGCKSFVRTVSVPEIATQHGIQLKASFSPKPLTEVTSIVRFGRTTCTIEAALKI